LPVCGSLNPIFIVFIIIDTICGALFFIFL
jgi:hypothetical protein